MAKTSHCIHLQSNFVLQFLRLIISIEQKQCNLSNHIKLLSSNSITILALPHRCCVECATKWIVPKDKIRSEFNFGRISVCVDENFATTQSQLIIIEWITKKTLFYISNKNRFIISCYHNYYIRGRETLNDRNISLFEETTPKLRAD